MTRPRRSLERVCSARNPSWLLVTFKHDHRDWNRAFALERRRNGDHSPALPCKLVNLLLGRFGVGILGDNFVFPRGAIVPSCAASGEDGGGDCRDSEMLDPCFHKLRRIEPSDLAGLDYTGIGS